MIITFGRAKSELARFAGKSGKCPDSSDVDIFTKEVIEELLNRGASGSLKKWVFYTQNGIFTAPSDLEMPVYMHIDGETRSVFDKYYEFYDSSTMAQATPCEQGLIEEINPYYTHYDLPEEGAHVLVIPQTKENCEDSLLIAGTDIEHNKIYMPHNGVQEAGERVTLNFDEPQWSQHKYTSVTGIQKPVTNGYVKLYWYDPSTGERGLLAEYKPSDTEPSYRRFKVSSLPCDNKCYKVTILGKVRFCDNYADNDIVPITSLRALKLTAQQIQAEDNDNIQTAQYKDQRIERVVQNENSYKRTPSQPVNFVQATSPGNLKNMI